MENLLNGKAARRPPKGEVVTWLILSEKVLDELQETYAKGHIPVQGLLAEGRVMVTNQYGASWTMSVDEFDADFMPVQVGNESSEVVENESTDQ